MNITSAFSQDQKFFSIQELKESGLSQYQIRKLVNTRILVKLNKTYYENTNYHGEESDFYYVNVYAPNGVICLLSAAVYYHLTTYIPDTIDVAIPRKAAISTHPDYPQFSIHYFTDARYSLGICNITEGTNHFKIYDIEKTVTDIVFYREKIGISETKEILTTYLKSHNRNLNKLLKYAELTKCDKPMRQYLEMLV